jgi:hypothetical protein
MSTANGKVEAGSDLAHGSLAHALQLVKPSFDAAFYREQYPDVVGDSDELLLHFCERGWKEGRSPNAGFDTVSYLMAHPDVAQIGWNPFYHYLLAGNLENRLVVPAFPPRSVAERLFGHDPGDWVALLRAELDAPYYLAQFPAQPPGDIDLVAHFAFRGWRENKNPNRGFNVADALTRHPELRELHVNPLVAALVRRRQAEDTEAARRIADQDDPGLISNRFPREKLFGIGERLRALESRIGARMAAQTPAYEDEVMRLVATELDRAYYLATYPDVREYGLDPVRHYCNHGAQEGRNPTLWFDTAFYLRDNADIAAAGVNPFWHYLIEGRNEGRSPSRPGGYRRTVIEAAVDPDQRTRDWSRPEPSSLLTRMRLERLLRNALSAARGLIVALSHNCYVRHTGGIQLFIAEEQARFARQGMVYLHLSPYVPLLRLADPGDTALVNIVVDGRFTGVTTYAEIAGTLAALPPQDGEQRMFLLHCALGHQVDGMLAVQRALASTRNVFWAHDYSSICVGYTLLRNDAAYCGAPPLDSMSCRICVYGERRAAHLAQIGRLFETIAFHVVAPSQAALDIWLQRAGLPHLSARVHAHCELVPSGPPHPERSQEGPVRVAFIGYARTHNGWPLLLDLLGRTRMLGAYHFVHLGAADTVAIEAGTEHHLVETSPGNPDAMLTAVRTHAIDLVLVLSTWPETFSYVTFEALAGGADVVCLRDSGNIADTVLRQGRGVVAADEKSLNDFFVSLRAVEYVQLCREQGTPLAQLARHGTTATIDWAAPTRGEPPTQGAVAPIPRDHLDGPASPQAVRSRKKAQGRHRIQR